MLALSTTPTTKAFSSATKLFSANSFGVIFSRTTSSTPSTSIAKCRGSAKRLIEGESKMTQSNAAVAWLMNSRRAGF